jgi:ribosomal protein S6
LNTYEGMFVIDTKEIRKGPEEAEEKIRGLITKVGGELAEIMRWDERKLAYEINGRDSGLYMLTFFRGGPDVVKDLNRECQLSSFVLRLLPLRIKDVPDLETVSTPSRAAREREEREKAKRAEQDSEKGDKPAAPDSKDTVEKAPASPAGEAPAAETPAVEAPVVETPVVETPVAETPAVETPATEAPADEPAAAASDQEAVDGDEDRKAEPEA